MGNSLSVIGKDIEDAALDVAKVAEKAYALFGKYTGYGLLVAFVQGEIKGFEKDIKTGDLMGLFCDALGTGGLEAVQKQVNADLIGLLTSACKMVGSEACVQGVNSKIANTLLNTAEDIGILFIPGAGEAAAVADTSKAAEIGEDTINALKNSKDLKVAGKAQDLTSKSNKLNKLTSKNSVAPSTFSDVDLSTAEVTDASETLKNDTGLKDALAGAKKEVDERQWIRTLKKGSKTCLTMYGENKLFGLGLSLLINPGSSVPPGSKTTAVMGVVAILFLVFLVILLLYLIFTSI